MLLSMTSTRIGASHFAFSTSLTRYLGAKLTLHLRWGLCSQSTHCGSKQPRLLQQATQHQPGISLVCMAWIKSRCTHRQSCRNTSCKSLLSSDTLPSSAAGKLAMASAAACCTTCWFSVGFILLAKAPANWMSRALTYSCKKRVPLPVPEGHSSDKRP